MFSLFSQTRGKFIILFLGIAISIILATLWWLRYTPAPTAFRTKQENQNILIAHAGGAFEGKAYSNSQEAVDHALANGFQFIELDLLMAQDDTIVAAHDWQHFNQVSNGSTSAIPDGETFKGLRIFNSLTPLTASDINNIFFKNPSAFLVTDKIANFTELLKQISIPPERMLVEVFSYKKYKRALRTGILYPMLCIRDKAFLDKHMSLLLDGKIMMITLPVSLIPEIEQDLEKLFLRGVTIFAFTANDQNLVAKYSNRYVTGFYTDSLKP